MIRTKSFKFTIRAITGNLSQKRKESFDRWLEQSSDRQEEYRRWIGIWSRICRSPLPFKPDVNGAWSQFEASIAKTAHKSPSHRPLWDRFDTIIESLIIRTRPAIVSAGVLLILVACIFLWRTGVLTSPYRTVITRNKQIREFHLSDGSHVSLNAGSSLRFTRQFSESDRQVELKGEAYFTVKTDSRSFTVITPQAKTTVLGTEFNVWSRGNETRVIVKYGKVRLTSIASANEKVDIIKGQMSRVLGNQPPLPPQSVDANHSLGWLRGQLIFEKALLTEIVDELERKFDVNIIVADSSLVSRTMTADFEDATIQEILASICLSLDIHYTYTSGDFILAR